VTTIAFCGAGHITGVHGLAAKVTPGLEVTHVASRTETSAIERAEQLGAIPCAYDDLPAGADIVLVATPPPQHVNDAMRALQASAAAIIEKPLATRLDDADRLVDAERRGARIGYAENLAFAPILRRALQSVGALGPLELLVLRTLHARPDWGGFLRAEAGGGVLFDLGPHPIAVALLLAAPARPVRVEATLDGAADIEVDDHAEMTLTFDTGLRATFVVSWRQDGPAASISDVQASSATGVLRIELLPSFGLEMNGEPVSLPDVRAGLPSPQLERMGYVDQLEQLGSALAAGRPVAMSAAFGRTVLDVICGAYASAGRGGAPVALPFEGPRAKTPLQLWRA
jgi:predicted dehydrogenase